MVDITEDYEISKIVTWWQNIKHALCINILH